MLPIPSEKLKEGAMLCRDNAVKLAECTLNISDDFPTIAYFLAILAFEEVGKGICLIENYEKGNDLIEKEWCELSKNKGAHLKKLRIVHRTLLDPYSLLKPHKLSVHLGEIDDFKHMESDVARQIHRFKLGSIYVNWNADKNKWETPLDKKPHNITEALTRLANATQLLSQKLREYE